MDLSTLQDIKMPTLPLDIFILGFIIFPLMAAFKRGPFRELLIGIAFVPYIASLFYLLNEFIQDNISFDSLLYKGSALGAFYIIYLVVVWLWGRRLDHVFITTNPISLVLTVIISLARSTYLIMCCLVFFNLHINQPDLIENSRILKPMKPYAKEIQNFLLDNSYLDNEVTIYEDAMNGTFDEKGNYVHPLMKKIKESDRFKDIQSKIDTDELKNKVNQQIQGYLKP